MYQDWGLDHNRINQWYYVSQEDSKYGPWKEVSHENVPDWVYAEGIKTNPNCDKPFDIPYEEDFDLTSLGIDFGGIRGYWSSYRWPIPGFEEYEDKTGTILIMETYGNYNWQNSSKQTKEWYQYRGGEWDKNGDIKKEGEWIMTDLQPKDLDEIPQTIKDIMNGSLDPKNRELSS